MINALIAPSRKAERVIAGDTIVKTNEGTIDRVLRVLVGAGILSLAFVGPQTPWAYLGVIPLVTGLVGFCPLYAMLGINTCGVKKA